MVVLSIITPVYNNVAFIEKCIQNVLSQNCDAVEHIIMDGGSTDGTVEIIEKYASEHSHIQWVSEKDKGQSDAMNKGVLKAKGNFISFLNVDDFYSENAVLEVLDLIMCDENLSFIVGDCDVLKESGELYYTNRPKKLKPWNILSGYYFPVNPSAYFYKRSLHEKIGMYNTENHYNMDIEFLIEASLVTKLTYFPKKWGNFRLLANTKTVSDQEAGLSEQRKIELFNRFLKAVSVKIKILTLFNRIFEKNKRRLLKLKKIFFFPFEMVYWKMKQTIKLN